MQVKICGIMRVDQGVAIARLGATMLGFIAVPVSPRYVRPEQIAQVTEALGLAGLGVERVGVFADAELSEIVAVVRQGGLTAVQLHGGESLAFCQRLRDRLPEVRLIKAVRVRSLSDLERAQDYALGIDRLLLDAYHPQQLGGTGQTLDWGMLRGFRPGVPWLLAGGLTPENVAEALALVQPQGIDVSSGVELAPGDKDLERVQRLLAIVQEQRELGANPAGIDP